MRQASQGVTLIELVVTIAVLAVLLVLAVPSFSDFRERSVLRGVSEGVVGFVGESRFEAVKRNRPVRITFTRTDETAWCLGANDAAAAPCKCSTDPSTCSLGVYGTAEDRRGVRLIASTGFSSGSFVFDPSRGTLTDLKAAGDLEFGSPTAGKNYKLKVEVNPLGRVTVCSSDRVVAGYEAC